MKLINFLWQKKLLVESQKMIPETQKRLGTAVSELREVVVSAG